MSFFSAAFRTLMCFVLISVVLCHGASALCPSNGNTHVIYVTSNMGDNVWSFDTVGHFIGNALNKASFPFSVEKLRAMVFGPGGFLYITSARGESSRVFAVSGNGVVNHTLNRNCTRDYLFTVTSKSKTDPFLDHPYSIAFHPETDTLYVANQNSVTVTRYERKKEDVRAVVNEPSNVSPNKSFPEWKPAQNVVFAMPNKSADAPAIPQDSGLFASSWSSEYTMASVRGLALSPLLPKTLVENATSPGWYSSEDPNAFVRYLLVCDIAINKVHVFLANTGQRLFALSVSSPVQVLFPSHYSASSSSSKMAYFDLPHIYVTSKEEGMTYLVPFVAPQQNTYVTEILHTRSLYGITRRYNQHSSSGILENPSHDMLLIADRSGRKISKIVSPFFADYKNQSVPPPFLGYFASKLPDQPEFILMTAVEQQTNIPFCYELNADGTFRYVALCAAAYLWTVALILLCFVTCSYLIVQRVKRCNESASRRRKRSSISAFPSSEEIPIMASDDPSGAPAQGGYGTASL